MLSSATPWCHGKKDKYKEIPRNLFPKSQKKLNETWCASTYKYFHYFDASVPGETFCSPSDLKRWESKAIQLMDEIKAKGLDEAKNEIVHVAKKRYKLKTIDNKDIVNFDDVVSLFKSPQWYYEDVERKRQMLYMFQYGIFRTTSNTWLHEAEYDWMYSYKVTYMHEDNLKNKNKKTFVQELLHVKASNTIQDRFLKNCQKYLGEHLLCRNRIPSHKRNDGTTYKELTFMNYTAHLVTNTMHKNTIGIHHTPQEKVQHTLTYAKEHGMSKQEIMMLCESLFNTNGKC